VVEITDDLMTWLVGWFLRMIGDWSSMIGMGGIQIIKTVKMIECFGCLFGCLNVFDDGEEDYRPTNEKDINRRRDGNGPK